MKLRTLLYDLNSNVVVLATVERRCSMVELLASDAQSPDFFVSYWWGVPVVLFLKCLKQHSTDRGLESKEGYYKGKHWGYNEDDEPHPEYLGGRSPLYWICVYANNCESPNRVTHCTAGSLSRCSMSLTKACRLSLIVPSLTH